MNTPISIDRYEEIATHCEDMELDAIWFALGYDFDQLAPRTEAFLWMLERLLKEGHIKLGENLQTNIQVVHGSVEEQVEQFRRAFPKNEEEMNNGYWFFDESCPAGVMWQHKS